MRRVCALLALLLAAPASAATVTSLTVTHRQGQSFVTFTKNAGATPSTTYQVRRGTSQITTSSTGTLVATLNADSWHYLFDDSAAATVLANGFVISDLGTPLASTQGLLVWTTQTTGCFYYGVFTSDDSTTVSAGNNTTTNCTTETYAAVPGVVLIEDWVQAGGGSNRMRKYFAWERYDTWGHGSWGYYGNKFCLAQSITAYPVVGGTTYPLTLDINQANGFGVSQECGLSGQTGDVVNSRGFYVSPIDMNPSTSPAAYANFPDNTGAFWMGFPSVASPTTLQTNSSAIRVVRYMKAIAADSALQIDNTRWYITGASRGGVGMHLAYDAVNAGLFAAVNTSSGIPDYRRFSGCSGSVSPTVGVPWWTTSDLRLDTDNQKAWGEWANVAVSVTQARSLPPVMYWWATNDTHPTCIFTAAVDNSETAKQAVFGQWVLNGGHSGGNISGTDNLLYAFRFKSNEAYPAFTSVANNDDDSNMTASGQHNLKVDWDSYLHDLGGGSGADLYDHSWQFQMSFKSTTGSTTTATVTLRNLQNFTPIPGTSVGYYNVAGLAGVAGVDATLQSGFVTVSADGSITIASLSVTSAGNRLTVYPGDNLYLKSDADYSELSVCSTSGTSLSFGGAAWTIATTTATVPASSDNFKLYRNGTWTNARGFIYVVQGGVLYMLSHHDKWYQWDGASTWTGPIFQEVVGCRLPESSSGAVALQNNVFLSDAFGGTWIAACSEMPDTYGYGLYCPDFPVSTLERGIIIRNGGRFPDCCGKRSMPEPDNTPWNLKYCSGAMYLLEYNANPATKNYTKWGGPGVATWADANAEDCVIGTVTIKRRLRFRTP